MSKGYTTAEEMALAKSKDTRHTFESVPDAVHWVEFSNKPHPKNCDYCKANNWLEAGQDYSTDTTS